MQNIDKTLYNNNERQCNIYCLPKSSAIICKQLLRFSSRNDQLIIYNWTSRKNKKYNSDTEHGSTAHTIM